MSLPNTFIERLQKIIPPDHYAQVLGTFSLEKNVCFRINTIRLSIREVVETLTEKQIPYQQLSWEHTGIVLDTIARQSDHIAHLVEEGVLYKQNASSMFPIHVLAPQCEETFLDMCAAPGSKTSQAAAYMKNTGQLWAVDVVPKRMYKLRSVLKLLGIKHVKSICCDARRFRTKDVMFDKILVDAPCSSEGRFRLHEPKTYAFWSERKIKEMVRKQRGILLNASRYLAPGGKLLYATCSFSPEENEGVVDWFLRKHAGAFELADIDKTHIPHYAPISTWEKKQFHPSVSKCLRILPDDLYDGFFCALIQHT